jgi:hypothetical protein
MGYTHYWYRKDKEIDRVIFDSIAEDFKKLLPNFDELGIRLAGGDGQGNPTIEKELIAFNGLARCGHPQSYELGIAWPSETAGGISNPWIEDVRRDPWFGGLTIDKRTCSGDCSHETCFFPRTIQKEHSDYFGSHPTEENGKGWHFDFCKTAYKPYDLAVTVFLVITKRYLKERIWIVSDGGTQHWADARILCQKALGYGIEFELDHKEEVKDGKVL